MSNTGRMSAYEANEEEYRASSTYKSRKLRWKKLTQARSEEFAQADSVVGFLQSVVVYGKESYLSYCDLESRFTNGTLVSGLKSEKSIAYLI
jgi:hypothetical protein